MAAKVADQGQGESDCSHPDRKSKRSTPRGGGVEEKGAISQAKLLLGCRRENITAITAPGRRGGKESEVVEEQKAAGRRREVPNKSSIISVTKHVRSHKQIE